ncbi:MAG: hypothetical protein V3T39_02820 [Gammaproteobacteria bacterium]
MSTSPPNPLTQFLAVLFTLLLAGIAFVFGLVVFMVILGASVMLALALWIRQKLLVRKVRSGDSSSVIDAEFQIIDKSADDENLK